MFQVAEWEDVLAALVLPETAGGGGTINPNHNLFPGRSLTYWLVSTVIKPFDEGENTSSPHHNFLQGCF